MKYICILILILLLIFVFNILNKKKENFIPNIPRWNTNDFVEKLRCNIKAGELIANSEEITHENMGPDHAFCLGTELEEPEVSEEVDSASDKAAKNAAAKAATNAAAAAKAATNAAAAAAAALAAKVDIIQEEDNRGNNNTQENSYNKINNYNNDFTEDDIKKYINNTLRRHSYNMAMSQTRSVDNGSPSNSTYVYQDDVEVGNVYAPTIKV